MVIALHFGKCYDGTQKEEPDMPLPLKPGYNFDYAHVCRPPYFEMTAAEAYTDFYGIFYMLSGERLIYFPNSTVIVQAGEMVFIPKNLYRRTTYISDAPYERILLKFTDDMVSELFQTIGEEKYNELCEEHVVRFPKRTQNKILSILKEMEREWDSYDKYSELILKGLLNQLIILCLNERTVGGVNILELERKNDYLANAIKYVKAYLRENPSLNETAHQVNVSPSYLSKIFISHLHTPFSSFLLNEKIAYAQRLLRGSKMNMTEIAIEAGFSSSSCFSDCFRRSTGLSPMQFRKEETPDG